MLHGPDLHGQNAGIGVVVFEGTPPPLPEGAKVRVELVEQPARPKTLAERCAAIIGIAKGLPPNLAAEHDHYIHRHSPSRRGMMAPVCTDTAYYLALLNPRDALHARSLEQSPP